MTTRRRITIPDLISHKCLSPGDIIYNIAHNCLTQTQDRLYVRVEEDGTLTVIDGQIVDAGTKYKTLNEFMRNHLNMKIIRGETRRITLNANVWDWTFTEGGRRFKELKEYITGERLIMSEDDRVELDRALEAAVVILKKYKPTKEETIARYVRALKSIV
jgi:hypothetical protein